MVNQSEHPSTLDLAHLLDQCDIRFTRRSGPGGQNRNKVETAVIITHRPTALTAEASERRSQGENRDAATFRLRIRLALEIRTRPGDGPSPLWHARCSSGRISVNPEHTDFPALLAEALDVLAATEDDPKQAAERLQCSTSQLVKFIKEEPRAIAALNERRKSRGLRPLL